MNTKEAQQLIKNTFEQDFNKNRFEVFIRNLLKDNYEKAQFSYTGNYIPAAYREFISKLERLGKYEDYEGNLFDVLVVELQQKHSVHAARVTQRNFIRWYLNGSRGNVLKDGALVAFHNPEAKEWRFSFVKMQYSLEKQKDEFTPAKRYSYLVGENEHSHTAQKQLVELLRNDEIPSLEELENSFSIEKVTQRFFDQYKELFLVLKETIDNALQKDPKAMQEFTSKNIDAAAFAKKTLGQIVFLYFLQKKGWLGVKEHENWGTGNRRFLNNLHEQCINEDKNFFNDYLKYLFYDALANERPETDEHQKDYYERFGSKIPFLNGGLFEPMNEYDWKNINLIIPNTIFSNNELIAHDEEGNGILDIFNRYNFTVKEDEPLDTEVAVDPEMLGKVFENLLEITDRRSKGAFYTPREIVHYMCQESLINYLYTQLSESLELSESFRTDIETFIKNGTTILEHDKHVELSEKETKTYSYKLPESIRKNANAFDTALANVKICDPAIGSGAFPVGLLHEIITARQVLDIYLKNNISTYELKRHAIYESIYGVDIDPSAVDIAKLRLWLSLVVDEENYEDIKPLPNLDYKIACGNSLIGLPQDIIRNHELEKQIEVLKEKFFNTTDQQEKHDLKIEINHKIKELIKSAEQFISYKIDFDFRLFFSEVFNKNPKNSPEVEMVNSQIRALNAQVDAINKGLRLQGEDEIVKLKIVSANQQIGIIELEILKIEKIISKIYGEITKVENNVASEPKNYSYQISALNKNIKQLNQKIAELNKQLKKNTPDEGGFDIVIGNPPYVGEKGHSDIFEALKKIDKWLEYYRRRSNTYYFFIKLGIELLHDKGIQSLIIPREFISADWANKVRAEIINKSTIYSIVDFNILKVFDDAGTTSLILTTIKQQNKKDYCFDLISLNDNKSIASNLFDKSYIIKFDVKNIDVSGEKPWNFYQKNISNQDNAVTLNDFFNISQGLVTGADRVTPKHINNNLIGSEYLNRGIFILQNDIDIKFKNSVTFLKINENWEAINKDDEVYIKPFIKTENLQKWFVSESSTYVIHVGSNNLEGKIRDYLIQFSGVLLNRSTTIPENTIITLDDFEKFTIDDIKKKYSSAGAVQKIMRRKLWWLPLYERADVPFDSFKIIVNTKNMDKFSFSNTTHFSSGGGAGGQNFIFLKQNKIDQIEKHTTIEDFTKFINAILNSSLIQKYIKDGKYNQLSTAKIGDLPIIYPDFENDILKVKYKDILHCANKQISTYPEIQKLYNQTDKFINTKFQVDIKNVIELEFADFLKLLTKAKIKLNISEEAEWLEYFDVQKQKIRDLKEQINKTDKEIDQIVYELYKLTPAEIETVENSMK